MKKEIIFGVVVPAIILATNPCLAAAAIALALPPDVAKDGIEMWGFHDAATMQEAEDKAVEACKSHAQSPLLKDLCKVVATYSNQCSAQALDPQSNTPGWGYAIANNSADAQTQALANCRATAGPTRQDACAIVPTTAVCDGSAK